MSDTDGKVKLIRNPERSKTVPYKPYVPQYQIEGKEPGEYHGAVVPSGTPIARPNADNPRLKKPVLRQPYAPSNTTSPIGRGKGPVPNVGNNMEHTWAGPEIVDDLEGEPVDPNHPMIDNNEFVTEAALGFRTGPMASELKPTVQGKVLIEQDERPYPTEIDVSAVQVQQPFDDLLPVLADLTEESYLLIVGGVPVCSGPKEEIEDQARAIVFGEHEICEGNPIPVDDIIILKRVKVKVGLFLE